MWSEEIDSDIYVVATRAWWQESVVRLLLQEYRQQITAQPPKGHSADGTNKKISKRVHESSAASTKPALHSKRPDKPRSLEVRNSQGSTDVVSETDFQMTEQRSQGSTEVFSLERRQSKS